MDPLSERKTFQVMDKSFRVTWILKKSKILNSVVIAALNFVCMLVRKIYASEKNKSGIIVIISTHRLGDTVFTIPAITNIYNHYNNYKKFIVCFSDTKDILAIRFNENDLVTIEKEDILFGRRFVKSKVRNKIRSLNPEIIFDLTGQVTSASMIFNSQAPLIIGTNIPYLKALYNKFVSFRTIPTFMDIYLDVVRLVIPIDDENELKTFPVKNHNFTKILIHPFAIRKAKEWSLNSYIQLAKKLSEQYDAEIICPSGFISEETKQEIKKLEIRLQETRTLKDLIDKIKTCSIFISNDSGPIYIASLLGKATFTIYGPTNPAYSLPKGANHNFIKRELKCSALPNERFCFTYAGVFCPSNECLGTLSLDSVNDEIRNFISKKIIND
jgi:ADP-heptose:LPS heptosyltransferase